MALRYRGKPYLPYNRQVDAWEDWCRCKFIEAGYPMDSKECQVHGKLEYPCDLCLCTNYRPRRKPTSPTCWPLCMCGHVAQDHN